MAVRKNRPFRLIGGQAGRVAPVARGAARARGADVNGVFHTRCQAGEYVGGRRALAGDGHRSRRVRRACPIVGGRPENRTGLSI